MNFFEGLDETGQTKLVDDTLKEVDANNDKVLSFSEFTTCYNKLKAKTEEQEAASVKLPSIFGEELSASEQLRVKAMPKMLDRGVFAPRKKEAASKDYFDTVAVRDKMFKADWSRIDKKASFVQFKQDVGLANYDSKAGKLKPTPLLKFFKTALRTQYDMLCNAYTYYGCRDIEGKGGGEGNAAAAAAAVSHFHFHFFFPTPPALKNINIYIYVKQTQPPIYIILDTNILYIKIK